MNKSSVCKICRRLGTKLFLKGERCFSPKCPMIRRPYPPGKKGKRRPRPLSEYGKELREKQKLKNWYNLQEKQFANYVKKILAKKKKAEDPTAILIKSLENRLDNVIFRLGFAVSREQAKQFVSHGHFLVNGKSIDTPAYSVRKGDVIAVKPHKAKKTVFQNIKTILKKQKPPSWLELSIEKLEGKVIGEPSLEEAAPPVEVSAIFEYYSR
ncbi:MAG: 30S ribosomal protein S4 [Parcubacteria group bacterium CG1_02_39_15]|uniref:Small ribosomal subunit protein uS4 n=3 Tax=Candidatus Nealsoniibacteriota TaxID=1817911 RepID=A0A2H0MR86_9BACT|nr:MAG: 30S ribosomal protein S4 [Parcubacteria group bacterium CG1_02_39_15]PIQ98295.1 MAG: 30S ribosomal protein S4 [Candidatus Nealsonbacteria bacterium CG11_big_fil_rev_8_21_14_0_20_39_9]PIW89908.1 MAG: 30S ribosomal protein S4 [Candidatus Nealsonbacteria bacterium CG_4_8_14_3_um_filter_40_11]